MTGPAPPTTVAVRRRTRRRLAWSSLIVTTLLAVPLAAFLIAGCAAFGAQPAGERLARARQSPQWHGERFENPQPMWAGVRGAWRRFVFGPSTPKVEPDAPLPMVHAGASAFARPPATGLRVTWFGHSSALIEIDGGRVLVDPFWSERASPVAWAGPRRWYAPPAALSELPEIDVVLISHDHYDHLDQATIVAMAPSRAVFVVPLGVGAHLSRWGIPDRRIIELDWWQSARVGGLELIATPARHASGRVSTKSDKTLWAGYAIVGAQHRAWYSGDTGFHADLARIGRRLGPFDVTLIEAGQYDADWPDTHLGPELAVEAHRLVRGKAMIPVHWALLKLANHPWTEPAERVLVAARCRGVHVLTPRPGESVEPGQAPTTAPWWPRMPWRSASEQPIVATKNGDASERVDFGPCLNDKG
jgi:L-ascorbate metabolism protein UlaG (beta-lactamase superfamily)